ncbi:MAG: AAA family ATPase [Promethearchaeota archaeon]
MESITIDGVEIFLSKPSNYEMEWIGQKENVIQLMAAWAVLDEGDIPMCPRILGPPGVGKTTLAYAAAKMVGSEVYIFQCTSDTRPEDLLVTPVIGSHQEIRYHASPLVTAMIKGGICILDEGNRMPEKAWASLAPLLDKRRYVESIIAGIKIYAHPDFRICCTMNRDASVFEIPEYISSRLQPKIYVDFPSKEDEMKILEYNIPFAPREIIEYVVEFLQKAHKNGEKYSIRDGINITRYMLKLASSEHVELTPGLKKTYFKIALTHVLDKDALIYVDRSVQSKKKLPKSLEDILFSFNKKFFSKDLPFDRVNIHLFDDDFSDDSSIFDEDDDGSTDDGDDFNADNEEDEDDGDEYDDDLAF